MAYSNATMLRFLLIKSSEMKRISVFIWHVFLLGMLSATGIPLNNSSSSTPLPDGSAPVNHPPNKPVLITPPDGSTVRLPAVVEWDCTDPDGDVLTYSVHVSIRMGGQIVYEETVNTGTESRFDSRDYDNIPEEAYGLPIEFQVTASDGELQTTGDVWTVTVSGMNNPPVFSGSPVPADQSLTAPGRIDFSWKCTDADYDFLRYTFCYREAGAPVWECAQGLLSANYSLDITEDDAGKTFEWKVRADDGYEVTQSPEWLFSVCTPFETTEDVTICANETYLDWSETGTYTRTLKAANGCDSIVTTNLTVESNPEIIEYVEICEGETYLFRNETGTWQWYKPATTGCDTLVTTHLTVWPAQFVTEDVFICEGESYKGHTTSGSFTETLVSTHGCDSVVTTNLTVIEPYHVTETVTLCEGDSYRGHTEAGTYVDNLVSVHGCDSIVTTTILIVDVIETTEYIAICEGESYQGWTSEGTYTRELISQHGCDSIVTTVLTVNPTYDVIENIAICEGDNYEGWTTEGTYSRELESMYGCDSMVTTHLTLIEPLRVTEDIAICEGESWKGWDTEGQYKDTLTAVNGCDSIVTTHLTVNPVFHDTEEVEIYNGDSYKGWTTTGAYNDTLVSVHGCDSIITTHLTVLNNAPDKPALIAPPNNAIVMQPFDVEWECSDPDGDTLTYTVRIRPQGNILWAASQNVDTITYYTIDGLPDFVFGIPIEWQVMAHDGQDTTYSDIWSVTIAEYIYETEYVSICEGESYKGWTTEGQYKDTLTTTAGYDSIVTTWLTVNPTFQQEDNVAICEGESWKGRDTAGEYADTLTTVHGCDSIVTTYLTVYPVYHETENVEIYNGDSYKGCTTSGEYNDTLISVHGCDSIITTYLTVLNNPPEQPVLIAPEDYAAVSQPFVVEWECSDPDGDAVTFDVRIRAAGSQEWIGSENTGIETSFTIFGLPDIVLGKPIEWQVVATDGQDTTYSEIHTVVICGEIQTSEYVSICQGENYKGWELTGQYADTLTATNGCDSIVTTHLTVHPSYLTEETVSICQGESYKGYTQTGTYQTDLTSANGCDSTIILHLSVIPKVYTTEYVTICNGEAYEGFTTAGIHQRTLTSAAGCDSVVTTILSLYPSLEPEILVEADTLRADDTYLSYQWRDETGDIPGANNPEYVINCSGTYTLVVTGENGCQHVSEPVQVIHSASPDLTENLKYAVIPNPNKGNFIFRVESGRINDLTLKLMSATGQVIEERTVRYAPANHSEEFAVSHVSKGIYFLVVASDNLRKTEKIIIQ